MSSSSFALTGIEGLDQILGHGLPRSRMYLLQGDPGVGKTTVGMQFLLEGARLGETCLYVAMSETQQEIHAVVRSHGWSFEGIHVIDLSTIDPRAGLDSENTLFEPSEVELHEATRRVLEEVDRLKPDRVVIDSLSELRLLAQTALRYRRQILALKQYFSDRASTVLLVDDRTSAPADIQLQSLAHGVISLEHASPLYGADRRRVRIAKLRGVRFRSGHHDFTIDTGGVEVFPRLTSLGRSPHGTLTQLSSGVPALDALLGGGLDYGTSTLFIGASGCGKSSCAIQYAVAAVRRGEQAAVFMFDERIETMLTRTRALGTELQPFIESGQLTVEEIDAAEIGAGEFAFRVQQAVETAGCRLVVVDSLNGYLLAMASENQLSVQLHELLTYLGHRGVATVLVMAQHGLTGTMQAPVDVSYLADTVVLLRYFEARGRIRKAISVLKKRSGAHEDTIRELTLSARGVTVGAPLVAFSGVLTGVPEFSGDTDELAGRE